MSSHFHIVKYPFFAFADTQFLPFRVDMVDNHPRHFTGIGFNGPHTSEDLFEFFKDVVTENLATQHRKPDTKDSEHTGGHEVLTDGDCFLTHPFGSGTGDGELFRSGL